MASVMGLRVVDEQHVSTATHLLRAQLFTVLASSLVAVMGIVIIVTLGQSEADKQKAPISRVVFCLVFVISPVVIPSTVFFMAWLGLKYNNPTTLKLLNVFDAIGACSSIVFGCIGMVHGAFYSGLKNTYAMPPDCSATPDQCHAAQDGLKVVNLAMAVSFIIGGLHFLLAVACIWASICAYRAIGVLQEDKVIVRQPLPPLILHDSPDVEMMGSEDART